MRNGMSRGLWKVNTYSGESIRPCLYLGLCACPGPLHTQGRPEKALSSQLWLTLKFYGSRKWKLRQSCLMPDWGLKACVNTLKETLGSLGCIDFRCLRKSLSNHWLTANLTKQRISGHVQQRIETIQNSFTEVTKQTNYYHCCYRQQQKQTQGRGHHLIFSCYLILFKMSTFQQQQQQHI